MQVKNGGEITALIPENQVRDVGDPGLIGLRDVKVSFELIGNDPFLGSLPGGSPTRARLGVFDLQIVLRHDSKHFLVVHEDPVVSRKGERDPPIPVGLP